jgi:hypothetical protein
MRSYPFIKDLFTNILKKSNAFEGRFFVCPQGGKELNSDNIDQVVKDTVTSTKKWPAVLMMPPVSTGKFHDPSQWKDIKLTLFFLKTTYYDSNNQVSSPNPNTNASTHTILEDWHDMERAAIAFLRLLDKLQVVKGLLSTFRMDRDAKEIYPVSIVGTDRLSGVRLIFNVSVATGCEIDDYADLDINSITVPDADSHPEHKL